MAGHFFTTIENTVTGKPVASATMLVYNAGATIVGDAITSGTLSTIYSDDGVTQVAQSSAPLTSDSRGFVEFWTDETSVAIEISYDGEARKAISDVEIVGGTVSSDVTALLTRMTAAEVITLDATVVAFKGLTGAADKVPYFNGTDTMALADFTAAGRALVDDASASAQLTTLGFSTFGKTIIDDADAAATRTTLAAAAASQTGECIAGFIAAPADKSYKIVVKAPHGGTITEATTISASGTCTATFKINSTALGGTANSVSSVEQSQAHASNNVFAAGDDIVLTVSSNSSCADLSFSLKYTRTLA